MKSHSVTLQILVAKKQSTILEYFFATNNDTMCQIMYKWILKNKGILNKREYLGPDWPTYVWPADDITFCSIFTYFQYWCMYDLALSNTIKMTHIVWFWLTWSIKTNLTVYSEDYTMWIRTMQGLAAGSRYEPVLITYMI